MGGGGKERKERAVTEKVRDNPSDSILGWSCRT